MAFGVHRSLVRIVGCALLLVPLLLQAQPVPPDTLWTYTYAGPLTDEGHVILGTADGGYVIGGRSEIAGGGVPGLLIRLDAEGQELWVRNMEQDYGKINALQETESGDLLLGGRDRNGSMAVLRTDSLGMVIWARRIIHGIDIEEAADLAQTDDGGLVAVSEGNWTAAPDIDLVRLSGDGDSLWTQSYGGPAEDHAGAVLTLGDGGFVIAGSRNHQAWVIQTDSSGTLVWDTTFGVPALSERLYAACLSATGDLIVAGSQTRTDWTYNGLVARVRLGQDTIWTRAYPELGAGYFWAVQELSTGEIILGSAQGEGFAWTLLSGNGELLRSGSFGTPLNDGARDMCVTEDEGITLVGEISSLASNSENIYVICTQSLHPQVVNERPVPTEPTLLIVFPNPFNSTTMLRFSLPVTSEVRLTLYDVTGRVVMERELGRLAAGEHAQRIEAEGLASGIYFARVRAGTQNIVRKIALVR